MCGACTSLAAYHRRIMTDVAAAQGTHWAALMPALAVAKQVWLYGVFWAIQVLVFPFRICWAAPVQLAAATVTGALAVRGLGCAVKNDPPLLAAAGRLCAWVEAVSAEALAPGAPLLSDEWGVCGQAGMEFLVAFIFCASSLLPVRRVRPCSPRCAPPCAPRGPGPAAARLHGPAPALRPRASEPAAAPRSICACTHPTHPHHTTPPPGSCTWSTPGRSASRWATSRRRAACRSTTARAARSASPARATPSPSWAAPSRA
jgi:hypothetical protein